MLTENLIYLERDPLTDEEREMMIRLGRFYDDTFELTEDCDTPYPLKVRSETPAEVYDLYAKRQVLYYLIALGGYEMRLSQMAKGLM